MENGMFVVSEQENGYFFARVAEVNQETETFFRIMRNNREQDLFNPDVQETFLRLKEKVQQNHIFKIERSFLR